MCLAAIWTVGCSSKPAQDGAPSPPSASVARASSTAPARAASGTPAPSANAPAATTAPAELEPPKEASPKAQPATDAAIRQAVQNWHDAILARSPERLNAIYAARVNFYGQRRARDQVVSDKMKALARAPDYSQTLSSVRVTWGRKDEPVASFEKRWSGGGKSGKVAAWLRLARERGQWRVATESDGPTDDLVARAHSLSKACEAAAIRLVLDTKEAQARRATQGPSKAREFNGVSLEGVTWPLLDVNIHEADEAGLRNTVAWFAVNAETGTVAERDLFSLKAGAPLAASAELQQAVRKQCRKP